MGLNITVLAVIGITSALPASAFEPALPGCATNGFKYEWRPRELEGRRYMSATRWRDVDGNGRNEGAESTLVVLDCQGQKMMEVLNPGDSPKPESELLADGRTAFLPQAWGMVDAAFEASSAFRWSDLKRSLRKVGYEVKIASNVGMICACDPKLNVWPGSETQPAQTE